MTASSNQPKKGSTPRLKRSARNNLNSSQVNSLPDGYHADGGGLYLSVKNGEKDRSWLFRYAMQGRTRWMGLGPTYDVSLSQARKKAAECREQRRAGLDPLAERQRLAVAVAAAVEKERFTFEHDAQRLMDAKFSEWTAKHLSQWQATLKTYAFPVIGKKHVAHITTDDVLKVLEPIWATKTETAKRVQGRIESVLDFATALKHRKGDNPARWVGLLEHTLPKPSKTKKVKPLEALPYSQVPQFMTELRTRTSITSKALEFTILTATRTTEVLGATWDEINLEERLWTVPGERMKSDRVHEVPLSERAVELLSGLHRESDYLFPGMKEGKPLSNMAMLNLLKKPPSKGMGYGQYTVHGFRSSFRDWAGELTAYPRDVCEMALAHSIPDKTEAAYRRGTLLTKRRKMMEDWSKYCGQTSSGEVVAIRG
jgi:integrase